MDNQNTGRDAEHTMSESDAVPLTDREIEVLRYVADGLTNAEIAGRMGLSDKTVKSHVSNILTKLRLPDRTKAAVFAWKQGLTGK